MDSRNKASCIRPEAFAVLTQPKGPSLTKWSWYRTRGNINNGGIVFHKAFAANVTMTNVLRLAEVRAPTCLILRLTTTLSGFWTVLTPVSSSYLAEYLEAVPNSLQIVIESFHICACCLHCREHRAQAGVIIWNTSRHSRPSSYSSRIPLPLLFLIDSLILRLSPS